MAAQPEYIAGGLGSLEEELINAVRRFAECILGAASAPGLSIALGYGHRVIWEAALGYADLATARPMQLDSVTRAGSISKIYTSIAVLQLIEQGHLALFAPIATYLPDLAVENPHGPRPVTVHDLLTFRSGLAVDLTTPTLNAPPALADFLRRAYTSPHASEYGEQFLRWSAPVGERFQYSNLGIATLGYLVERTNPDGLSFSKYVTTAIVEPLGLSSTVFSDWPQSPAVPADIRDRLTTGYSDFGRLRAPSPVLGVAAYPSSGVLTTAGDHLRLLLALQDEKGRDVASPLGSQSIRLMQTPQIPITLGGPPSGLYAGVGLILGNLGRREYHFGYPGLQFWGWSSDSRVYPHLGLSAVAFANKLDMLAWHDPSRRSVSERIVEYAAATLGALLAGVPPPQPRPWGWSVSYAAGFLAAERLRDFLGIADLDGVLPGTLVRVADETPSPVQDAFAEGFKDGAASPHTPGELREHLRSGGGQLHPCELELLSVALGGNGEFPVPLEFGQSGDPTRAGC